MKIINLIRCEFIKNYNIKKFLFISLILFISSLFLVNITNKNYGEDNSQFDYSIRYGKEMYNNYLNSDRNEFKNNYYLNYYDKYYKLFTSIENMNHTNSDWKIESIFRILDIEEENYIIKQLLYNKDDNFIKINCEYTGSYEQETQNTPEYRTYELCKFNDNELKNKLVNNEIIINDLEELISKNKYYLYLGYMITNNMIKSDNFIELAIDQKIERNDNHFGYNYNQYKKLEMLANMDIVSEKEYDGSININDIYINFEDYNSYKNYVINLKKSAQEKREILYYSTKNNISHDINYNYYESIKDNDIYMNSKFGVNQVYHLSIIVMLIIAICFGGIVSREHSKGTIKNLIVSPTKRWKILLSKYLFIIINVYIIWLLGLLILSIVSGLKFGFGDLFTSKLIYSGNKVIELNYYLYILKNIFLASIPVICFVSIMFFLSTVSLNTSLTVGVSTVICTVSSFIWLVSIVGHFKQIVYTPFWYFDLGYIFNNSYLYNEALMKVNFSLEYGIIISLIISIILYIISNYIYINRDIKNN